MTSQKDRVALNNSHNQVRQLESGFQESQTAQANLAQELQSERQEHRLCQENLQHELVRHHETERVLESVWSAHARLGEVLSQVNCYADGETEGKSYNVAELVLEVSAKTDKIHELESKLEQAKNEYVTNLIDFKRRLHQTQGLAAMSQRIGDLATQHRGQGRRSSCHDAIETTQGSKTRKGARSNIRAEANEGRRSEDGGAGLLGPGENVKVEQLPVVKEEKLPAIKEEA